MQRISDWYGRLLDGMLAVEGANITSPTTLDRLTIESGNATGSGVSSYAMLCTSCGGVTLKNSSFVPATQAAYLRNCSARTGIRAQLAETIDNRLAPAVETAVYRIVQEALSNVAQHSGATACTVSLNEGANVLNLVIEDNGAGLEQTIDATRRGLGLIGMRERAQALGGTFSAVTRSGGGTHVAVTLPLTRTDDNPAPATAVRTEHGEPVANTPR